jgi:flagellar assembly protein FliH
VLAPATDTEHFEWTQQTRTTAAVPWTAAAVGAPAATPRPAMAAPSSAAPADTPGHAPGGAPGPTPGMTAAAAPAAVTDEALLAEHRERLAGLEREAFTKGYAQGERAGLEAGGKRAEAMLRRVAQTIEELGGLRQTLIHETEREMVQLALTLARRVVHREVTLDPELAAALAHVALERLGTTTPATIRLNPEDYTIVAQDDARWGGQTVTVVPDPSISRGGCLVESAFGSVDATIERQFDELSRALFGAER